METWYWLEHDRRSPFWNMACDEWLLTHASWLGNPILRTYAWDRPSISLGYFQTFPDPHPSSHTVVRRPTGGALVLHDVDLTFTVVLPPFHPWRLLAPHERYQRVHERVYKIFELRGLIPILVSDKTREISSPNPSGRASSTSLCFAKNSRYDVMLHGEKIAGGAQRVNRDGLLHQGSIQGESIWRASPSELRRAWEYYGARFTGLRLTGDEELAIQDLVISKYATTAWNRR